MTSSERWRDWRALSISDSAGVSPETLGRDVWRRDRLEAQQTQRLSGHHRRGAQHQHSEYDCRDTTVGSSDPSGHCLLAAKEFIKSIYKINKRFLPTFLHLYFYLYSSTSSICLVPDKNSKYLQIIYCCWPSHILLQFCQGLVFMDTRVDCIQLHKTMIFFSV